MTLKPQGNGGAKLDPIHQGDIGGVDDGQQQAGPAPDFAGLRCDPVERQHRQHEGPGDEE